MYPFASVGEDQSDIGAGSASGQPFLNRSTRSGLEMNGLSYTMRSARPAAIDALVKPPSASRVSGRMSAVE